MESTLQDLRFALRWLRQSPGFCLAAILTMALGIGANSAMFSLVNSILLRPLPYAQPDRLVRVWAANPQKGAQEANVNPLDFADVRRQASQFDHLVAMSARTFSLRGTGDPERLRGALVSADFFNTFGAGAVRGRTFGADEERAGAANVVVLSDDLWQRRFHGDGDLPGKTVIVDDAPAVVIGILAPGFRAPGVTAEEQPRLYKPLRIQDSMGRGGHWLRVFGRLRGGATQAQAQAQLAALAQGLATAYPKTDAGWQLTLQGLKESEVGSVRAPLVLLFASVGLVLLIACANVANLLLARASARQQEVVVRSALGAGTARLVRQMLTESVLLALLGAALGVALVPLALHLLAGYLPAGALPRFQEVSVDGRVLAFSFGVAVLTGLAFGVVPALRTARSPLGLALRHDERSGGGRRLPSALIVGEIAVALVLLVGAGLLIKSFSRLLDVDPGFHPANLLAIDLDLPDVRYAKPSQISTFYQRLLARAGGLPQVQSTTAVDILPFSSGYNCSSFTVPGIPAAVYNQVPCAEYRTVAPGYLRTMGIRLLRGRPLAAADDAAAPPVTLVNEKLARQLWQGRDPIGRQITLGFETEQPHTVVGVVANVHHFGLAADAAPEIYVSYLQHPSTNMTLVLRGAAEPHQLAAAVRAAVSDLDPQLPLGNVAPVDELIADSVAQPRLRTLLLSLFSGIALLLAAVGILGVVAYSVVRRTREIGIRLALGAGRPQLRSMLVRQTMGVAAIGLGCGLLAALAATRLLASSLFGVAAYDVPVFAASTAILALIALLACYVPAWRASQLDPLLALRAR
jgi:putative ABC transport system permease protein